MVNKVRAKEVGVRPPEIDENMLKAINDIQQGKNIHEVLAEAKVPRAEMHKFFANQYRQWKMQIIQENEAYASYASIPEPNIVTFNPTDPNNSFKEGEGSLLLGGMFGGKAMATKALELEGEVGAQTGEGMPEGPMTQAEIEQYARETLDEWDNFMGDMWSSVLDAQMVKDYEARMAEIQQEVKRLITLAKEGKIGVEFVLIALAKVNTTKNGVLFSWLGKKAFAINEDMTRASEELQGMSTMDPGYFGALQGLQADTREGSFQLNMVTGDMQKVMQNVSSTLESVHGMMGEINRTRREIISKVSAMG